MELTELTVNSGYFKAFALSGRQVCVLYYPGRCPGLGASALSGRVGNSYCLRACGELFHFRFNIALGESRFDDVASLQLRGRTDALAIFQRDAVTTLQQQLRILRLDALLEKLQSMILIEHLPLQYRLDILRENL